MTGLALGWEEKQGLTVFVLGSTQVLVANTRNIVRRLPCWVGIELTLYFVGGAPNRGLVSVRPQQVRDT